MEQEPSIYVANLLSLIEFLSRDLYDRQQLESLFKSHPVWVGRIFEVWWASRAVHVMLHSNVGVADFEKNRQTQTALELKRDPSY